MPSDAKPVAPGTVPKTMIGIEISSPGGPDVLRPREMPTPAPGPGEVLIKVAAAGVNRPDVLQRRGSYPPPAGASPLPGLEVAGEIVSVGSGVTHLAQGDAAMALVAGGGYAQYCTAPAPQCLPVPAGLSLIEAAAMPETFFTVWTNLFERAELASGQSVLIHGGSSGIGTVAIQLAAARGATVYATAGSAEKCAACERLGAARAIDYHREDFVVVIEELTEKKGVEVVLDMVGGDYIPRNIGILAQDGIHVSIAVLMSSWVQLNIREIMMKRLWLTGSTLRPRTIEEKGAIAQALLKEVWPLVEAGKVRPVIHATFPLEKASEAHALMESSAHIGKLVLET